MTELEAKAKDCIENHTHKLVDKPTKQDIYLREESIFISGYKLGATETTEELQEENKELTLKVSRLESDCDAYNYSQRTYQEEIKELKAENEQEKEIIKLAIKGIKKIACEERCDFVNKEFFCDDCAYGKWIAKAETFINKE